MTNQFFNKHHNIILVLCEGFDQAQWAFHHFWALLEQENPEELFDVNPASYYIENIYNVRYIFIDYRFQDYFPDVVDTCWSDEFFESY